MHSNRVGDIGGYCILSPFFNDRKSSIKGQSRGGGCNSNNTSWPVQPWYSQALGLSVAKPLLLPQLSNLSKSSGPGAPSRREQNPTTSGLESFRQSLASEGISERATELIAGARRPGTSFNYELV